MSVRPGDVVTRRRDGTVTASRATVARLRGRLARGIVGLGLLLAAGASALAQATDPPRVQLFAHRGFTRQHPENSMAALEAAVALGVAGAEIDLRTTRDGHVVLMHDPTVGRTTTGMGAVDAMTLAEIGRLRLRTPDGSATNEPVPALDAVLRFLAAHRGFRVAFDSKSIDVAAVGRQVLAANAAAQVTFFVDDMADVDRALAIKRVDRRLQLSINLRAWWQIEGLPTFAKASLDADALFSHEFYFPRFGFQEAQRTGAEMQVYVPGVERLAERVERAIQLGARVISTDRPDLVQHLSGRPVAPAGRYVPPTAPTSDSER